MLAEERKSQLGMLRAVGLTRRRLVGEFAIEGAVYALIAALIGLVLGALIGRGVVGIAETIMNQWNSKSQQLDLTFGISATSMINGFAAGFVIAFLTVVLTSVRLSRLNVIAAIRDLPSAGGGRPARRWVVMSSIACVFFAAAAVVAVASSAGAAAYVLPALAALTAVPALRLALSPRAAWTSVSLAILVWSMTANLFRPDVFDSPSMTVYIALGVLVTFSAVLLISQNQSIVLWPVHRLLDRPSETALTARLALAYPTTRRFRTGATLVMYSIVVFVVVLLTQIGAILNASKGQAVADSGAGWTHRVDVNGTLTEGNPIDVLRSGPFAGRVVDVMPLVIGHATATDPGHRTEDALPVTVVGLPDLTKGAHEYLLDQRMAGFDDDEAVWAAVASSPEYVVVDAFFGSGGGPQGQSFQPGDRFTITDPATETPHIKTIAGVMSSAGAFYNIGVGEFGFPVLTSAAAATADVSDAGVTSFMLDAPAVDHVELVTELQGRFLAAGLVATSIRQTVEQNLAASQSFFRLMQGFLALGLLVGIIGLGVVMVRSGPRAASHDRRPPRTRVPCHRGSACLHGGEHLHRRRGNPDRRGPRGGHDLSPLSKQRGLPRAARPVPDRLAGRDRDSHRNVRGIDPRHVRPRQAGLEDPPCRGGAGRRLTQCRTLQPCALRSRRVRRRYSTTSDLARTSSCRSRTANRLRCSTRSRPGPAISTECECTRCTLCAIVRTCTPRSATAFGTCPTSSPMSRVLASVRAPSTSSRTTSARCATSSATGRATL